MDTDVIEIETSKGAPLLFDTSNLTIIFMGAFADLYQTKEIEKKKPIGFGSVTEEPKKDT